MSHAHLIGQEIDWEWVPVGQTNFLIYLSFPLGNGVEAIRTCAIIHKQGCQSIFVKNLGLCGVDKVRGVGVVYGNRQKQQYMQSCTHAITNPN